MTVPDTKPKQTGTLRIPQPKKRLGLAVPPALRLPHDDLIMPEVKPDDVAANTIENVVQNAETRSMPSQTRHTQPQEKSMPSLTRHTSELNIADAPQDQTAVSPQRDFTKVANSINREAVPAGLFSGKSKQLYDCLYSLTRGAITPTRSVRISRPKLMKKAHIGSRITFDTNIERLVSVGLISVTKKIGEHEGNEYIVYVPEEIETTLTSQTSMPSQTSMTRYAQKLVRLVGLETSHTSHTSKSVDSTTYDPSNTFFKTNTNDDDDALAEFTEIFREASRELTGQNPLIGERERWTELARAITQELRSAAARTGPLSSVPAFLTAHLKRRFSHKPVAVDAHRANAKSAREKKPADTDVEPPGETGRRLAEEDITEHTGFIVDLLNHGYSLEQTEAQFAAGFHPDDWAEIKTRASKQNHRSGSGGEEK